MRRTIIIVSALILLIVVSVGVYLAFFRSGGITVGLPSNPFGSAGDRDPNDLVPVTDTGVPIEDAGTVVAPKLLQIAVGPVARGANIRYVRDATDTASTTLAAASTDDVEVRYIERQSGNTYSFKVHERVATRLSNKTLPGIQEASWLSDGSGAFVRFLEKDSGGIEHVSTYMLPINGEGGYFLEQDLSEVKAASSSVLTLLSSGSGSIATLSGTSGTGGRTLFSSALSSLHIAFAGSSYVATTKATAHLDGYAFQVNSQGAFSRLLGPLRGLATLPSPSGTQLLYSYVDRGTLYMQVLDIVNRTAVSLPLTTLAEKCAWSQGSDVLYCAIPTGMSGMLPDDWYQGAHTFSDRLWRIDLASRVATLVFDPKQLAGTPMDLESLAVDSESDVIIFMNRMDGSLWSYDL